MQIDSISIKNYRCFADLELILGGDSMVLVGPNSSGKASLLEAVRAERRGAEVVTGDPADIGRLAAVAGVGYFEL